MSRAGLPVLVFLLMPPAAAFAQNSRSMDAAYQQLAQTFKPVLVGAVPETLYEKSENWGHQVMVPVGVKFRGLRPQVTRTLRDHGEWRKIKVTAQDLKRTLDLKIYDVKNIDAEKQTFKVSLAFQMGIEYEQRNFESGLRLWSGSVCARTKVTAHLDCENTFKIDIAKNGLPDFVLRLRVTGAKLEHDKPVIEHVAGIGGDGAKLIGNALYGAMKQWRPGMERDLLAKTSAAIVRAADTREIRLGFGKLLK